MSESGTIRVCWWCFREYADWESSDRCPRCELLELPDVWRWRTPGVRQRGVASQSVPDRTTDCPIDNE